MSWSDRWIAKAAHVILAKYSSNPPLFPACTPEEYKEAYDFMDRVLACVNACAEVPIETLRDLHVNDMLIVRSEIMTTDKQSGTVYRFHVGDIVTRDGTDEQIVLEDCEEGDNVKVCCIKEPALSDFGDGIKHDPWIKFGEVEHNCEWRYDLVRSAKYEVPNA